MVRGFHLLGSFIVEINYAMCNSNNLNEWLWLSHAIWTLLGHEGNIMSSVRHKFS